AIGYSDARREVMQRGALRRRSGRHLDRLNRIERTDGVERRVGHNHISGGGIPVVHPAVVVIGGAEALPAQTEVQSEPAVHFEGILRVDASLVVKLRAIGERIAPQTGKRQAEQEIGEAIAAEVAVEVKGPIRAFWNQAA